MDTIPLLPVKDATGRAIPVSLRTSIYSGEERYVIRFGDTGRDEYGLATLVEVALRDTEGLIVSDMFDGSQDYVIPLAEIQAVVRQFMYPRLMPAGRFEVDVKFISQDNDFPF